jgi:RNA polymerase sigma-70 factor, ECF subfamily
VDTKLPDPYSDESITVLLNEFSGGKRDAGSRIHARISEELLGTAAPLTRNEWPSHMLQPRLQPRIQPPAFITPGAIWQDLAHFFAIASPRRHRIFVDYGRKRAGAERGGMACAWRRYELSPSQ